MPRLFVYGSLMNARSREDTTGRPVRARRAALRPAAHLRLGWSFRSARHRMTCLALYPDPHSTMSVDGMVLWVDDAMLAKLDVREEGYERIRVSPHHIQMDAASHDHDHSADVYTYVIRQPAPPTPAFPVTARYRALCSERQETP